ncbi:MAG TPA: carboxylesterase/lipase family protein [Acidisarcina sp.]
MDLRPVAITRLSFLNLKLLALFSLVAVPGILAASNPLVVSTRQGKVEGMIATAPASAPAATVAATPIRAFLGIPFAAPPVGPLRWKPPMPAAKWNGIRQAKEFGSHCMQPKLYADMVFRDPGISEDCLTLNVWTPAPSKTSKASKLPVMVWIYGGGFATGGTSEGRQDGANLATHGVVVVTMNYRLGVFGYFAHAALAAESGKGFAGNYGLLDQTAALRWVQQNIKAFGGDPANVTLFGESAGSFSVSAQMASPLAKGLFERVIGESGGALFSAGLNFPPLDEVEKEDAVFAQSILNASTLEQMRAVPAQELLDASMKKTPEGVGFRFSPDVDGYFLPESVASIYAAGKQNDVPMLAGWNRDEGGYDPKVTAAIFQDAVGRQFAEKGPDVPGKILKVYAAPDDASAVRAAADLSGDRFIAYSTWKWIEAQATTGHQPVYRYRFDLVPPADPNHPGGLAAYHSSEIPYVFGDLDLLSGFPWRPEDRQLSEQMQRYWTNFARTGDPNSPAGAETLPKWPPYTATTGWMVMHLSAEPTAEPDDHRDRYLLLDTIWGK